MMRFLKLLIFFSFLHLTAFTQVKKISGTVYDMDTKQPVESCNVIMLSGKDGTLTNEQGNFTLCWRLNHESEKLVFQTFGYKMDTVKVSINQDHYKIYLKQEGIRLESVVVTGVAKTTLIRENPISITSVPAKAIETSTESNVIDALVKNVPGLTAVKTGPNISKPFIHGLGYNRVLTLYDGIRQEGQQYGDEHGLEIDDYHVDKVEVMKGPASLLYGSDAIAGVISFFPYLPTRKDGKIRGRYLSEYHTNNNLIGQGLRLDYADNAFTFALRGSYRMAQNYRNPVDGRVYLTNFNVANLSATAGYQSAKGYTHLNFTLYDNHQGIPDGSRDSLSRAFTKQILDDEDDIKARPLVSDKELSSYKTPVLSQHIQHYRAYLHSFYTLGKGNMDVLLGAQQNIRREYTHPDEPTQAGMYMRLNTLNYGVRYNAPTFGNVETSIGINGMLQDNNHQDATDFPIPNYQLYEGGMYLYGKWKKDRWSVSGGIRDDLRYVHWDDFYVGEDPLTGYDRETKGADIAGADLQFPFFNKLYHGISGSLGATFQVNEHISLKTNIGRAYRSPNITEIGSNGLDPGAHIIYIGNRDFNPEFSLQEDIGVHLNYANFSAEINLFNNNIKDFIYMETEADAAGNPILDDQGNRTYAYKQSTAHLYGADVWFAIHPKQLKGWRWDTSLSMVYGFNRNPIYKGKGTEGEYLPLIPPFKMLNNLSYEMKLKHKHVKSIKPQVELEYEAKQNRYLGLNGTETSTPSFALFNIGLSSEIQYNKANRILITLQANNLFNQAYQSHLNRLKYFEYYEQSPNGRYGMYNMGRNIASKAVVPF